MELESLYMASLLITTVRELWEQACKLDLVKEVRQDIGGTEPTGKHSCFYGKGNKNHELDTSFSVHKIIMLAVRRVRYLNNRMAYIMLRGRWCYIIIQNVNATTEDKIDEVEDGFYEEL